MAMGVAKVVPAWGVYLGTRPDYIWAERDLPRCDRRCSSRVAYKRLEFITTTLVAFVTGDHGRLRPRAPLGRGIRSTRTTSATGFTFSLPAAGAAPGVLDLRDHRRRPPRSCSPIPTGASRRATRALRRPATPLDDGPAGDDWGRRARGWLSVMQLDAWFSMVVFHARDGRLLPPGRRRPEAPGVAARGQPVRDDRDALGDVRPAARPLDPRGLPARRLGGPLQDDLRRHRRQ